MILPLEEDKNKEEEQEDEAYKEEEEEETQSNLNMIWDEEEVDNEDDDVMEETCIGVVGYLHPVGTSSLGIFLYPTHIRNTPKPDFYRSRLNHTRYVKENTLCVVVVLE